MSSASMIPVALLAGLEEAVNALVALDPDTQRRLDAITGRVIALDLLGLGLCVYVVPHAHGIRLAPTHDGTSDVTLRGAPLALLAARNEPGGGLFGAGVTVEGDTELAQRLRRILDGLDIDWEEQLSRLTGDVVAHQVGNAVRGLFAFGRQALERFAHNAGDYVTEELELTPTRPEVDDLLAAVDGLRDDVERLAARVDLLSRRFSG